MSMQFVYQRFVVKFHLTRIYFILGASPLNRHIRPEEGFVRMSLLKEKWSLTVRRCGHKVTPHFLYSLTYVTKFP